jgi:SOS-response transcriptional repressor LexA
VFEQGRLADARLAGQHKGLALTAAQSLKQPVEPAPQKCPECQAWSGPETPLDPVLGNIQAGDFTLADPGNIEEYQALPAQHVHGEPIFLLRVRGNSMTGEDGVLEDDYVVVRQQSAWGNGDMVVVFAPSVDIIELTSTCSYSALGNVQQAVLAHGV